jgi:hypothetical protein
VLEQSALALNLQPLSHFDLQNYEKSTFPSKRSDPRMKHSQKFPWPPPTPFGDAAWMHKS